MTNFDKGLPIFLVVAILALGCLGYVVATRKMDKKSTEFYILNIEGKARNYPKQIVLGDSVDVIIGVVNHELKPASYRIDITVNGIKNKEITMGELANEEKWQEIVSFIPDKVGGNQKVEFWLYKNGEIEPYFKDPLHLYISVSKP